MSHQPSHLEQASAMPLQGSYGAKDLTVIVVSHHHAHSIERTLASIKPLAGTTMVLDRGSTDGTLEIAQQHTSHIFFNPRQDNPWVFTQALHQIQTPWVLWLCADEWLPSGVTQLLRQWFQTSASHPLHPAGYTLACRPLWRKQPLRFGGYTHRSLRIFPKDAVVVPEGATTRCPVQLSLPQARSQAIQSPILAEPYSRLSNMFDATPLDDMDPDLLPSKLPGVVGLVLSGWVFIKHYVMLFGWLDGLTGLVWAWAKAHRVAIRHLQRHHQSTLLP